MKKEEIIQWLLEGDQAIRYQTCRDLLGEDRRDTQELIEKTGWGRGFLDQRREDGHWGLKFYQPKWTSSHYTLLDLRSLCLPPGCKEARDSIAMIADGEKGPDGGINPAGTIAQSNVCINGMFLNYASWFGADEESLHSVVDFILSQVMADGGFNCRSNRSGAVHSSMHSTICVCEGIAGYRKQGYSYRLGEMEEAEAGYRGIAG